MKNIFKAIYPFLLAWVLLLNPILSVKGEEATVLLADFEEEEGWLTERDLLGDMPGIAENNLLLSRYNISLLDRQHAFQITDEIKGSGQYSGRWDQLPYYPSLYHNTLMKDWSAYQVISIDLYSAVATKDVITLLLTSDDSSTPYLDFYYICFQVDWQEEWRTLQIPFEMLKEYGDPAGFGKIDDVGFYSKIFNFQPNPYTKLYFDRIKLLNISPNQKEALVLEAEESGIFSKTVERVTQFDSIQDIGSWYPMYQKKEDFQTEYIKNCPPGYENMTLSDFLTCIENKKSGKDEKNYTIKSKYGLQNTDFKLTDVMSQYELNGVMQDLRPIGLNLNMNSPFPEINQNSFTSPFSYQPYFKYERAIGQYYPKYTPGPVSFDPDGNAYIRHGYIIQTLNRDQKWVSSDLRPILSRHFKQKGFPFVRLKDTGTMNDETIRFDQDGDAYLLGCVLVQNSSGANFYKSILMHSVDKMKTWNIYDLAYPIANFEKIDGHNQDAQNHPPLILLHDFTAGYLQIPVKNSDGTLRLPAPIKFAKNCIRFVPHSGNGNFAVTVKNKVYLVYATINPNRNEWDPIPEDHPANSLTWEYNSQVYSSKTGTPAWIKTYDLETGSLSEPVFIGYGGRQLDDHNWPGITVDSEGVLHVIINGHHNPVYYTKSILPKQITTWEPPQLVGKALTYATLNCDSKDTLYMTNRDSGEQYKNGQYNARYYYFDLALHIKPKNGPWQKQASVVENFKGFYRNYQQKTAYNPKTDKLYLSYYAETNVVELFRDEMNAFLFIRPDLRELFSRYQQPIGTFNTQERAYSQIWKSEGEGVLTVLQNGRFQLAETKDFSGNELTAYVDDYHYLMVKGKPERIEGGMLHVRDQQGNLVLTDRVEVDGNGYIAYSKKLEKPWAEGNYTIWIDDRKQTEFSYQHLNIKSVGLKQIINGEETECETICAGNFIAKIDLNNRLDSKRELTIYFAFYDEDNKLVWLSKKDNMIPEMFNGDMPQILTVPESLSAYKMKLLIWDEMKPMITSLVFPFQQ